MRLGQENYDFFGAPVELFIFTHKSLGKYSASDAGLFMQNLILSAFQGVGNMSPRCSGSLGGCRT